MTPRLATARRRDDVDIERDRALVERCQLGDASAFDDLYLRYYARLVRFCYRRLGDMPEAEDAAQDAFARAWKAMPSFDGDRRFYPWLSVIASNLCVDMIRRNARLTPVGEDLEQVVAPVEGGQEAAIEQRDDHAMLKQALGRISPRHREVLQLREGYEWSYQQIAEHQGVQVSTIETLLFRARRSLRREYLILAEGQAGLAGFLLVLRNLVTKVPRRLLGRGGGHGAAGSHAAAGTGGASVAAAGAGAIPAAAGFVVTAVAAAAVVAVASLAPHPSLSPTGSATSTRSAAPAALSAQALLPLGAPASAAPLSTRRGATSGHGSRPVHHPASTGAGAGAGSSSRHHSRSPVSGVHVPVTGPVVASGVVTTPKVVAVIHRVASTVGGILGEPVSTLKKVVSGVGSTVHKVVKSVTKTVTTVVGANNPISGLLNGLGGTASTGSTGNTGPPVTIPGL